MYVTHIHFDSNLITQSTWEDPIAPLHDIAFKIHCEMRQWGPDSDSEGDYGAGNTNFRFRKSKACARVAPYGTTGGVDNQRSTGNNNLGSDVLPPRAEQAEQWTITASHVQVEVPRHELTHDRQLPLPCRIDAFINGKLYPQAPYLGHGLSKVVYRLTEQRVLKLCDLDDQEPGLFQELHASGVYPTVHAKNQCQQLHSPGWPARTWNAWVMDYAMPLDKILKTSPALSNVCIIGAIHAMLTAYSRGHIMSDNDFFNFGMVGATSPCSRKVVIIDAGSRAFRAPISKGDFNETVMSKFWKHVGELLIEQPEELKEQRQRWSSSGWVINDALQKYEECLQNLRHESNSTLQISRVDEVAEPLLDAVTLQQAPASSKKPQNASSDRKASGHKRLRPTGGLEPQEADSSKIPQAASSYRKEPSSASGHAAAPQESIENAQMVPSAPDTVSRDHNHAVSMKDLRENAPKGHDSQHDEGHEAAAGELWHEWGDEKLTDLHHSLNKGWFDRALWLLDKPETNVDAVVPWEYKVGGGNTALHFLAFKGGDKSLSRSLVHELATKLCSMSHLRLHQRNTRGLTALHVAASNGSDVVMRALLNARAGPFFKENHQKIYNSDDRSNFYILYRNKCW